MIQQFDTLLDEPFKERNGVKYEPFRYYAAPCQIPKSFKRELALIGGRLDDGRPRLRIQWGMDIRWVRNGKKMPRYVMSKDIARRERQDPKTKLWIVIETPMFFGDPHFVIEEWRPPEYFCVPGMNLEQSECYWEAHRYRYEHEEPVIDSDLVAAIANQGAFQREAFLEYKRFLQQHRPILCGDGNGNVTTEGVDEIGPFPRNGRYEYLTKLRPAGTHPNGEWLELIRRTFHRRYNRKYANVDQEIEELNEYLLKKRDRSRANQTQSLIENLDAYWKAYDEEGLAPASVFHHSKPLSPEGANA